MTTTASHRRLRYRLRRRRRGDHPTPFRAPNADAIADRWIRSAREECLARLIILNARHLRHVLREYAHYYNEARPHQGQEQAMPIPFVRPISDGAVRCRDLLGGIVHDYYHEAA